MNAFTSDEAEKLVRDGRGGRGIHGFAGKNTCKPSTGIRQQRSAAALREHLARHPNDKQSETHLAAL